MAELSFRLSKAEADALQQDWSHRKSGNRRSAEFKLRLADYRRAERRAYDDDRLRDFRISAGLPHPAASKETER